MESGSLRMKCWERVSGLAIGIRCSVLAANAVVQSIRRRLSRKSRSAWPRILGFSREHVPTGESGCTEGVLISD